MRQPGTDLSPAQLSSTPPAHTFFPPRAGFPTIKWFGESKSSPQDYEGGRDVSALAAFATERWASQQPPPEVRTGGWQQHASNCRTAPARLALVGWRPWEGSLAERGGANALMPVQLPGAWLPLYPHRPARLLQVRELVDEQTWEEQCVGHAADADLDLHGVKPKQLCLLAFLPHILDSKAEGREAYLQVRACVWCRGGTLRVVQRRRVLQTDLSFFGQP